MWDKNGFYFTEHINNKKYSLDVGASRLLTIENNKYVIFFKRRFHKILAEKLQSKQALITQVQDIDFTFDEKFFVYGLTYYQRNLKLAHFKGGDIDQLEIYGPLFEKFGLTLKLRKYLEIHGDYPSLENLIFEVKQANLNQAISFLLALATIYGDWNLVEEEDVYLSNVLIKFPFDASVSAYQQLIFDLEDVLLSNKIYNSLVYTKKGDFIWNIKDYDLLKIFGKFLNFEKVRDFFEVYDEIKPIYEKKLPKLAEQLNLDLRINLKNFKLTEIEKISLEI